MWKVIVLIGMTFEQYLAERRPKVEVQTYGNPYADTVYQEFDRHLGTVRAWLYGTIETKQMRAAMRFFDKIFGRRYAATEGRYLYRGQAQLKFDGTPRSYSYRKDIGTTFACQPSAGPGVRGSYSHTLAFLIRRKVCHRCSDKQAFVLTLDLGKVLSDYALGQHKYSAQSEVVILNTRPRGTGAQVFEIACERGLFS